MNARRATVDDLGFILGMSQAMHAESRYAHLPCDMAKIEERVRTLLQAKSGLVFVTPHGFILGFVAQYWFGSSLYAAELVLYVQPEARRSGEAAALINAYVEGARTLQVREVNIENSTGYEIAGVEALFAKCGFTRTGGNWIKEL